MTFQKSTFIQRIRWHLGDNPFETTGTAASSSSVIAVADGTDFAEGVILELIDAVTGTAEDAKVKSISTNDLTCVRGYYGTTAATHATTSRILLDPKYKQPEIENAISEVIEYALPWPYIYYVESDTITPDAAAGTIWYDLAANALALISAKQLYGTSDEHSWTYGRRHEFSRIFMEQSLDTSIAASGVGVTFPDGFRHASNTVKIKYARKLTDTTSGSPTAYQDFTAGEAVASAIEFGAVALLQGSTILRIPRHGTDEVDPLRGYTLFERLFLRARRQAERELRHKFPLMDGWDNR